MCTCPNGVAPAAGDPACTGSDATGVWVGDKVCLSCTTPYKYIDDPKCETPNYDDVLAALLAKLQAAEAKRKQAAAWQLSNATEALRLQALAVTAAQNAYNASKVVSDAQDLKADDAELKVVNRANAAWHANLSDDGNTTLETPRPSKFQEVENLAKIAVLERNTSNEKDAVTTEERDEWVYEKGMLTSNESELKTIQDHNNATAEQWDAEEAKRKADAALAVAAASDPTLDLATNVAASTSWIDNPLNVVEDAMHSDAAAKATTAESTAAAKEVTDAQTNSVNAAVAANNAAAVKTIADAKDEGILTLKERRIKEHRV